MLILVFRWLPLETQWGRVPLMKEITWLGMHFTALLHWLVPCMLLTLSAWLVPHGNISNLTETRSFSASLIFLSFIFSCSVSPYSSASDIATVNVNGELY